MRSRRRGARCASSVAQAPSARTCSTVRPRFRRMRPGRHRLARSPPAMRSHSRSTRIRTSPRGSQTRRSTGSAISPADRKPYGNRGPLPGGRDRGLRERDAIGSPSRAAGAGRRDRVVHGPRNSSGLCAPWQAPTATMTCTAGSACLYRQEQDGTSPCNSLRGRDSIPPGRERLRKRGKSGVPCIARDLGCLTTDGAVFACRTVLARVPRSGLRRRWPARSVRWLFARRRWPARSVRWLFARRRLRLRVRPDSSVEKQYKGVGATGQGCWRNRGLRMKTTTGCRFRGNWMEWRKAAEAIGIRFGVASASGVFAGEREFNFVVADMENRLLPRQCGK